MAFITWSSITILSYISFLLATADNFVIPSYIEVLRSFTSAAPNNSLNALLPFPITLNSSPPPAIFSFMVLAKVFVISSLLGDPIVKLPNLKEGILSIVGNEFFACSKISLTIDWACISDISCPFLAPYLIKICLTLSTLSCAGANLLNTLANLLLKIA